MRYSPCFGCRLHAHASDCEYRDSVKAALREASHEYDLHFTSVSFKCQERLKGYTIGRRCHVRIFNVQIGMTGGGAYEPPEPMFGDKLFDGWIVNHGQKVTIWLDNSEGLQATYMVRAWPKNVILKGMGNRAKICGQCLKPKHIKLDKWLCPECEADRWREVAI
jgi:hypothetical protein